MKPISKDRIKKGPELDWIKAYRGQNSFLLSLQAQAKREGLSPKQIARVQENIQREQPVFPALQAYNSLPTTVPPKDFLEGHGNWGLTEEESLEARALAMEHERELEALHGKEAIREKMPKKN